MHVESIMMLFHQIIACPKTFSDRQSLFLDKVLVGMRSLFRGNPPTSAQ